MFNWCYHGTVDESFASLRDGKVVEREANLGPPVPLDETTRVVEWNDPDALRRELAHGDVACVLAEPALTNIGIVHAQPGFHDALRAATRDTETLLIIDETHTLCAGPGGYTRAHGLEPDLLTVGKAIGSGIPSAAYGFSAEVAARVEASIGRQESDVGGVGGTLAANVLSLAAVRATLEHVLTDEAFARMIALGERFEQGVQSVIDANALPWHVTRLGCRVEYLFRPERPVTGSDAAAGGDHLLDRLIHLYALNRGVLLTPFHNMALDVAGDDRGGRRPAHGGLRRDRRRAHRRGVAFAPWPGIRTRRRRSTACTRPRSGEFVRRRDQLAALASRGGAARGRRRGEEAAEADGGRVGRQPAGAHARRCGSAACSLPGSGCGRRTPTCWQAGLPRRWSARGTTSARRSKSWPARRAGCWRKPGTRPPRRCWTACARRSTQRWSTRPSAERVRAGRLEKEEQVTGFGFTGLPAVKAGARKPAAKTARDDARRKRRRQAEERLREAREAVAAAEREVAGRKRELEAAERELEGLRAAVGGPRSELERTG